MRLSFKTRNVIVFNNHIYKISLREKMKNKGISPLVATVILIAISVSLALIINAWLVNYVNERLKEIETSYTSSMECIKSSFRVLEYLIEEREI